MAKAAVTEKKKKRSKISFFRKKKITKKEENTPGEVKVHWDRFYYQEKTDANPTPGPLIFFEQFMFNLNQS